MIALLLCLASFAADTSHQLVWNLAVKGQQVGTRTVTVKIVPAPNGSQRIMESFTELHGQVGPMRLDWRQRLTAIAVGTDPAAFTSVIDENGSAREIQGRWTPSHWMVAINGDGRVKETEWPVGKIDLSTSDLMDPDTRFPLAHFQTVRILSAESGDVVTGTVSQLGQSDLTVGGEKIPVTGFQVDSPQGKSVFWYSSEGYLVRYELTMLGIPMSAELSKAPPGGMDDFPVGIGSPKIEEQNL